MAYEYFYTLESAEIRLGNPSNFDSRLWMDLNSFSLLALLMLRIPLRRSDDFLESEMNVRREMELLEPREPDCMVKKESLELLE